MHPELQRYIDAVLPQLERLPDTRRALLDEVAAFVSRQVSAGPADLVFVCTHNSRRSQMAQLWALASAAHFGIEDVRAYSGGTEVTAFNPNAVAAVERAGFAVLNPGGENPRYLVSVDDESPAVECFSKKYDDPHNPSQNFAAIMTCSDADEACPVVIGASFRSPVRYDDPKVADGTPEAAHVYDERCRQIATEMLYLFSRVA